LAKFGKGRQMHEMNNFPLDGRTMAKVQLGRM